VTIILVVEGKTEEVFLPFVRDFLRKRLSGRMPKLKTHRYDGRIKKGDALRRDVLRLLKEADAVIALTDVYTGNSNDFADAADAKEKMHEWVGDQPNFYPHAAQHDFEAWLLPYWDKIKRIAGSGRSVPIGQPESVNHMNPPSARIREVFRTGSRGRGYIKTRDAATILRGEDLMVAAQACPELKSLLNTILELCEETLIS
jgi:hypothetical protein